MRRDRSRTKLPAGVFQEDEGGDRRTRFVWRPRRGCAKTNLDQSSGGAAIVALIGYMAADGTTQAVWAAGANLEAQGGIDDAAAEAGGLGEGGFGEGDFGA